MPTSSPVRRFEACSSPLQAHPARSISARDSRRPRQARQADSISWCPTSRRRARELVGRGVDVGEVFHRAPGKPPVSGRDPEGRSYSSFATFSDPDGNSWMLQEVTVRLPGRVDASDTTFASSTELAAALRRAGAAHGEHEKRTGGQYDVNWPDWYAEYMVAEQAGKQLPT